MPTANQSGSVRFSSNQRLNRVQHSKQLLNNLLRSAGSAQRTLVGKQPLSALIYVLSSFLDNFMSSWLRAIKKRKIQDFSHKFGSRQFKDRTILWLQTGFQCYRSLWDNSSDLGNTFQMSSYSQPLVSVYSEYNMKSTWTFGSSQSNRGEMYSGMLKKFNFTQRFSASTIILTLPLIV